MPKKASFLVTCEHGGNRIPAKYRHLFHGHEELLHSHRGYDEGALTMAKELAGALKAPLFVSTISRLLVDLNRSIGHPKLYSEATRPAPRELRREILHEHYLPYRDEVEKFIASEIANGRQVIHISSHSFTPVMEGVVRNAEVGLLYDPKRPGELALCTSWQASLKAASKNIRVRRNYPYTGTSDGFTAWLRKRFKARDYVGVELEMNQKLVSAGSAGWRNLRRDLIMSMKQALTMR